MLSVRVGSGRGSRGAAEAGRPGPGGSVRLPGSSLRGVTANVPWHLPRRGPCPALRLRFSVQSSPRRSSAPRTWEGGEDRPVSAATRPGSQGRRVAGSQTGTPARVWRHSGRRSLREPVVGRRRRDALPGVGQPNGDVSCALRRMPASVFGVVQAQGGGVQPDI